MKKYYFLFLFLFLVIVTPFASATTNDNNITYTGGGNQLTSGYSVTITKDNICIDGITRVAGETAPYAYIINPDDASILSSAAFSSDTAVFSSCYQTSINEELIFALGDVADAGNTVHYYKISTTFPIYSSLTPEIHWRNSVYNNSGVWTSQANSYGIESIETSIVGSKTLEEANFIHLFKLDNNGQDYNNTALLSDVGTPAYSTDAKEGVFSLDNTASTALETTGANGLTGGNSAMALTFWAKQDNVATAEYLGGVGSYSTTGTAFYVSTTSATQMDVLGVTGNQLTVTTPTRTSGTWYHFAAVYYGNTTAAFYMDGVLIAHGTLGTQNLNTNKITTGQSHTAGAKFAGNIDDFRIYDYALTETQINNIYNNPNGTSSSNPYLYIQLQDIVDNSNLEGLTVTLNDGTTNTTQSDGIAYFYNSSTQSFNVTDSNNLYFDYNSTSNPTENSTSTYQIYGAFPGIQAYNVEGNSINNFNITNAYYTNTTSTGTAYTYFAPNSTEEPVNVTSTNYYLYEGSINTTGQDTSTKNISGLYQSVITVNATNVYTGDVLNNYTGWIYNEDTGYNITFNTTGNQTTLYALEGNHTVFIDVPGYSISENNYNNQNYTALNNYTITFNLYSENSVNVNIYKEEDATPILENITVLVEGTSSSDTFYTNTSNLLIEGLSDGNYTFKLSGDNWTQRSYIVTVADRSTQNLNVYLSNASDTVTFTNLDFDTSQPIETVAMYQQRLINDTWTTIESKYTDITGRAQFTHDLNVKYRFTAEKNTYESKVFDLDPIIYTSYTIRLQKSLTVDTNTGLFDVSLVYYPKSFTNEANNTFTFTFGSVGGSLQTYGYLLTYPGGTQGDSGSSANGETLNTGNFLITGAVYGDYANLTYWYDSTLGSNKTYSAQITISNITNNNTLQDNVNNDYGLGVLDKIIIATIVIIIFAGVLTLFGTAEFGLLGGLVALGIFTKTGFISLWAAIPVFIVGILLLLRGRG